MEPDTDIQVEVVSKGEFGDDKWEIGLADSRMIFEVTAEDQKQPSRAI